MANLSVTVCAETEQDISYMLSDISINLYYFSGGEKRYVIKDNSPGGAVLPQRENNLTMDVSWVLPEADFHGKVCEGDFFEISLPYNILGVYPVNNPVPLEYGGEVLGNWYIKDDKPIKLEITEHGANKLSLSGTFSFFCYTDSLSEKVEIEVGGIAIEIETGYTPPGGDTEFPYDNQDPRQDQNEDGEPYIVKYGEQVGSGDVLDWAIHIDDCGNYNYYNSPDKSGFSIKIREKMYIEDKLNGPQVYDEDSLGIYLYLHRPRSDGKLTGITYGYFNMIGLLKKIDDPDMADLKSGVYGDGTYGFSEDKRHFVIYIGTFPSDKYTYDKLAESLYGRGRNFSYMLNLFANYGLTLKERTMMNAVYAANGIGGKILMFNGIVYETILDEGSLDAESVSNTAGYGYTGSAELSDAVTINLKNASGSIEGLPPGTAALIKKDADDDTLITGAKFKLQKQGAGTGWSDYTAAGGGAVVKTTDINGKIIFSDLGTGTYRFVEVETAEGYAPGSAVYSPETFTITSGQTRGVTTNCTNEKLPSPPTEPPAVPPAVPPTEPPAEPPAETPTEPPAEPELLLEFDEEGTPTGELTWDDTDLPQTGSGSMIYLYLMIMSGLFLISRNTLTTGL